MSDSNVLFFGLHGITSHAFKTDMNTCEIFVGAGYNHSCSLLMEDVS